MTNFFNKDILNNNSLEYLFNNELDYLFNKDTINKKIILNSKITAVYQIQNFNNLQNKSEYNINRNFENEDNKSSYNIDRKFKNEDNKSEYNINRKFNNKNNFAFYKLGIIQIPPKRITIKGFDD